MAFQLDTESEPGIVLVTFSGQVSVDERVEALREVRPLLEKLRRVLIDFRNAELQPGSGELITRHAENLAAGYKAVSGTRIAYLVGAATDPSSLKMMAASRGYFYQRFTDRASALRWLRFSRAE